jgi:hypothetical protein
VASSEAEVLRGEERARGGAGGAGVLRTFYRVEEEGEGAPKAVGRGSGGGRHQCLETVKLGGGGRGRAEAAWGECAPAH